MFDFCTDLLLKVSQVKHQRACQNYNIIVVIKVMILGTCQKLAEGRGVKNGGGSELFELLKREGREKIGRAKGRVTQIYDLTQNYDYITRNTT